MGIGQAARDSRSIREKIEWWENLATASLESGDIIDMDEQHKAMRDALMFAWKAGELAPVDELVLGQPVGPRR